MLDVNRTLEHEPEPPLDDEPEPPEPEPEPPPMELIGDVADRVMGGADARELALASRKQTLVEQADALQVIDATSYEHAAEMAKTFAGMIKDAEAHFDPDIAAANKLHKSLCEKKNTFLEPLQLALDALKTRARSWWNSEEEKRKAEARRLEEADRKRRDDEKRKLEEEARAAEKQGDKTTAADFRQEAAAVDDAPPPPPPPSTAPKVRGFTPNKPNWSFEVFDKSLFVNAVAGVDRMFGIVAGRIVALQAKKPEDTTPADAAVLEALIDLHIVLKATTGTVPLEAVDYNDVYLRARAKADKNTLKWPGVRFFDKGSTSVRP